MHTSHIYMCIYIYTHKQFDKVICLSSKYCNRGIDFMTQSIRLSVILKITRKLLWGERATGSCGFQNSLRPVSSSETCVGLVPGQF